MAATMKIKKGDTVQVLAGKDRGKQGRVIDALPREGRVIVENLNLVKRHRKPRADPRRVADGRHADDARAASSTRRRRSTSATSCSCARPASRRRASACTSRSVKGETLRVRYCKRCNEEVDR